MACSPKIANRPIYKTSIIDFSKDKSVSFHYFANGHLSKEGYEFKILEKKGRIAGEIVRAADARLFSGQYLVLKKPIRIAEGNRFSIDVLMDHLGTFTFKLEESLDGGSTTSITIKNTKINKWETLIFDFKDAIYGGPSYNKIAIFTDLHSPVTGKDVYSYFANINQLETDKNTPIQGDPKQAVKIVILGSSTAAGTGPSETRNSWVNRYRRQLQAENGYHQVINLAVGGYTTYHLLPTNAPVSDNRPKPNPKHNVAMAISLNPDGVLINLPSNDVANGYSIKEQLNNYRLIAKALKNANIPVWVSTPQSRNMSKEKIKLQKVLKDSTYAMFGRKTLDFWTDLSDWSGKIDKKYNCGDGVHLNDEGHYLLFKEVMDKDIVAKLIDRRNGIVKKDYAYSVPVYREGHALIWQDEFNGTSLDTSIWSHELGDGCPSLCGWGNAEKVWYRPENTQVKDGKLIITAMPDKEHIGYWSSSRIVTKNKKEFKYGRIDIRAKLPKTRGLWPALWLLGKNRAEKDWPYCGEIDIMEEKGQIPWRIRGTVFYKGTNGKTYHKGDKYELQYGNFSDNFHLFSIDWNKNRIKYFVDDVLFAERKYSELENLNLNDNPFLKPFYMLINLAVGGNYLGYPDNASVFPQRFEIDYVRYYITDKYFYCPKIEEKVKILPPKENLWIFILAGQSNMVGAGTVGPQDTLSHPRILTMNKNGDWINAKEPIHKHTNGNRGLDSGLSFARTLLQSVPKNVSIAIIPTAMGGSALDNWLKDDEYRGQHLWSNMKSKIKAAGKDGVFKGMLWHQGESDAKTERIPTYNKRFLVFLDRVRKEVNNPKLPVVVGEIGKFQTHRPLWLQFNENLHKLANNNELIDIIKTDDLKDKGDQVHFNSEGQRTMGIRYAKKMAKLLGLPIPIIKNNHKFMTYNVRLDVEVDGDEAWTYRKDMFVNQINEIAPDIFGIQEGLPHQVKYIKNHLSNYDFIGLARDGEKGQEEYSAIFFNTNKYKIIESNTIWLSGTPNKVTKGWDAACLRICTYGHFEDKKTGTRFWVFNTHLDHRGQKARAKGMDLILREIAKENSNNEPLILSGDFNVLPNDRIIKNLSNKMQDSFLKSINSGKPLGTFNGFDSKSKADKRIDYIFVNDKVEILNYKVDTRKEDGKYISDHFPVIVKAKF